MTGHYYNPYDPLQPYYDPLPENPTKEELEEYFRMSRRIMVRTLIAVIIVLAVCSILTSCTTTKYVSSETERHKMETLIDRMDSLSRVKTVVQQDSTWRQEILRQFQSIKERSDTSHYVVADTAGNIIRERIVINNTREVTSETDRQELTVMSHRLEQMDSTVQAQSLMISHMDSLMQQSRKEVVRTVETPASWWHNLQLWLGRMAMLALAVLAGWWIVKKRAWWLALLRKII